MKREDDPLWKMAGELVEERLAIMRFDGCMTEEEAREAMIADYSQQLAETNRDIEIAKRKWRSAGFDPHKVAVTLRFMMERATRTDMLIAIEVCRVVDLAEEAGVSIDTLDLQQVIDDVRARCAMGR